jgi:hypothetical protein
MNFPHAAWQKPVMASHVHHPQYNGDIAKDEQQVTSQQKKFISEHVKCLDTVL